MRYQGKIFNWIDEQGYGFVMPNGGGQRAFVHIKHFSNQSTRPANGDLITYELATDHQRRFYANNILFVGQRSTPYKQRLFGLFFTIIFFVALSLLVLNGKAPSFVFFLYFILSGITFIYYGLDKSAAKNNESRTPEKTLHWLSLIGGWPGALIAQKIFRHKSIKKQFQIVFWVTVMLNTAALLWLLFSESGGMLLHSLIVII